MFHIFYITTNFYKRTQNKKIEIVLIMKKQPLYGSCILYILFDEEKLLFGMTTVCKAIKHDNNFKISQNTVYFNWNNID